MKISLSAALIACVACSTASAFMGVVAPGLAVVRTPTHLQARADASAAIKAALDASKKFGATSPEARVAWDTVEEIDASDNR
jgi:CP12 domain